MTRKSFGKAGLKCFVCLLLSILAGILLMTCVYILPTGRMLTQADRSLPIFETRVPASAGPRRRKAPVWMAIRMPS